MGTAASGRRPAALLAAGLLGAALGGGAVLVTDGEADVAEIASPTAGPATAPRTPARVTGAALAAEVLDTTCGLVAVRGDHADWLADGRYCRLRLAVTNTERATHVWDASAQEVIDASGEAYAANLNATQIADQPTSVVVKPGNRLELDAWFDVPEGTQVVAARLTAPAAREQRTTADEQAVVEVPLAPVDAMATREAG